MTYLFESWIHIIFIHNDSMWPIGHIYWRPDIDQSLEQWPQRIRLIGYSYGG